MENKYPKTQNAVDEAGAWLLTGKRYKKGGGIENKIIGIAKTHPYSTETETYYKPIDKNLPSKFYNELGIVLENDKDFVEIVEIQFDTRKLITQGWHVEEDEPYFGKEQANDISELSKELQDWLVKNLLSSIKIQKELIANSTKAKLIKDLLEKTGKTKKECEEIVDRYNQIDNTKMAKGGKIVWVGDMPLDIDGREELTKEEAERLAKEWKEKGYDDVIIEDYAKGGNLATTQMDYDQLLEILKDKIDDTVEDLYSTYENSNDAVGEEVESKSRDGFIPYTNGGYSSRWFEYSNYLEGSGIGLPTKSLDDKIEEFRKNSREYAKERFEEDYPEIVKELGIENIDYNSLYNAGYGDEAEELDEYEREDDDSVMMEIQALYYNPQNDRGEDGKHTIRLSGVVNLEAPYHRTGNLEDFIEKTFTFSSYKDLEDKLDKFLAQIKSWFEGDMYSENSKELKIKKMSKGGKVYAIVNDNTDRIYFKSKDKNFAKLKLKEFQEINPKKKIILQEFAKGGKIGFDGLAKKVAKNYSGKKVPKKFQNQYGKTYSPAEAKEVGDKVAGAVYKMQQAKKMAKGGTVDVRDEGNMAKTYDGRIGKITKVDGLYYTLKFKDGNLPYKLTLHQKDVIFSNSKFYAKGGIAEGYSKFKVLYIPYSGKTQEKMFDFYSDAEKYYDDLVDDEKGGGTSTIILQGYTDKYDEFEDIFYFDPMEMSVQDDDEDFAKGGEIPSKIKKEFDKKIKNKKFAKAYLGEIEDEDDYEWSYKSGLNDYFEEWKNDNETFKIHNELRLLKAKGFKNVTLNGFDESILYVIDRKYNDYEIKKNEDGNYSTTFAKGGEIGDKNISYNVDDLTMG